MSARRSLALFLLLALPPTGQAAPKLVSVFPLGGQRGTELDVEVQGSGLEKADAVWFGEGTRLVDNRKASAVTAPPKLTQGRDGLRGVVKAVPDGSRATVRLAIAPEARVGFHTLYLVTPNGVSDGVRFWVGPHAVVGEQAAPHATQTTAQPVPMPGAVNGRLTATGEVDFYTF